MLIGSITCDAIVATSASMSSYIVRLGTIQSNFGRIGVTRKYFPEDSI
jgi:hypothetical protein